MSKKSRQLARQQAAMQRRDPEVEGRRFGDERQHQMAMQMQEIRATVSVGPFPAPETLAQYAQIRPDMLDRVLGLTERQAVHRQALELETVRAHHRDVRRSTYSGLTVALAALGVALALGLKGHDQVAAIIGGGDLVALVSVFIYGRHKRNSKAQQAEKPKSAG